MNYSRESAQKLVLLCNMSREEILKVNTSGPLALSQTSTQTSQELLKLIFNERRKWESPDLIQTNFGRAQEIQWLARITYWAPVNFKKKKPNPTKPVGVSSGHSRNDPVVEEDIDSSNGNKVFSFFLYTKMRQKLLLFWTLRNDLCSAVEACAGKCSHKRSTFHGNSQALLSQNNWPHSTFTF